MSGIELKIKNCGWLQGVPEAALAPLVKAARLKHYDCDQYLYRLGQKSDFVYGVVSGFVRIKINHVDGQVFSITEFSADEWLGELALTNQPSEMFEAQVLEDSHVIEIPKRVIETLAEQYPIIYKNLFHFQAERTTKMSALLGGMLFYPLAARLAGRILWFARHFGTADETGVWINKKMSQQELAELTMGSRQRINKILKQWERDGILQMHGQRYLIKDTGALKLKVK
jgi:CRP-like cAMP-binding protein